VQLTLSEKGQALRIQLKEHWHRVGQERLRQLSEEDLATLLRIYAKLLEGHETT
jgi:DNA-binding MarR family transcriptional regulator